MSAESVETQIRQLKGLSGTGESSELPGANRVSLSRGLDVCIAAARQEKLGLRGTPGTGLRPKCGGGPVEPLGALTGKRARASRRARVLGTAQGARLETRPGWLTADSALLSPLLGVGEPDPPPSLSGRALSPPPRTLPSPSGRAAPARLALDSEPRQSPRSLDPPDPLPEAGCTAHGCSPAGLGSGGGEFREPGAIFTRCVSGPRRKSLLRGPLSGRCAGGDAGGDFESSEGRESGGP